MNPWTKSLLNYPILQGNDARRTTLDQDRRPSHSECHCTGSATARKRDKRHMIEDMEATPHLLRAALQAVRFGARLSDSEAAMEVIIGASAIAIERSQSNTRHGA